MSAQSTSHSRTALRNCRRHSFQPDLRLLNFPTFLKYFSSSLQFARWFSSFAAGFLRSCAIISTTAFRRSFCLMR